MSDQAMMNENPSKGDKLSKDPYPDVMKVEFTRLHREYRDLEHKRHGIAQRDGYIRKHTDKLIPLLKQEQNELEYELLNATCKSHKKKASRLASTMKSALESYEAYQSELKKKIKLILEIEEQVDRISEKLFKQHLNLLAIHGHSKTMAQRERELMKAEDKLYHMQCSFNLQIHENKQLRQEIMGFLVERGRFYKMHNSNKKQITQAKRKMLTIVQKAIQTYDSRDDSMTKVKALREREAKEAKHHGMEVQEFKRTLHHDTTILEFIKTKMKRRSAFEDAANRRIRVASAREQELDAVMKRYTQSFKKILSYSETKSIQDLVHRYKFLDSHNYESFKYLTQLNQECEVLRANIETLKSNIIIAHSDVEKREQEQRRAQKKLQLQIIYEQEKINMMERQQVKDRQRHRDAFAMIAAAMSLTDCNVGPIMRLLGNKEGIDEHNVRLCLTQLDIKITEMKHEHDRLHDIKTAASGNINPYKPVLSKVKVQPSHGGPFTPKVLMVHGESVDDEDTKIFELEPYYYDEMKEYVFQKMIEDGQVDMIHRAISVTPKAKPQSVNKGGPRKTLAEQIHQSRMEKGGGDRRRRRKHPFNSKNKNASRRTSTDLVGTPEEARRKTENLVKIGQSVQSHLLRSSTGTAAGHLHFGQHDELEIIVHSPPEEIPSEENPPENNSAEENSAEEEDVVEEIPPEEQEDPTEEFLQQRSLLFQPEENLIEDYPSTYYE